MSKKMFRDTLLASTVIAGMTCFAAPAIAQDATQVPAPPGGVPDPQNPPAGVQSQESAGPAEPTSSGDIVVTGTLVRNPNLVASSPVAVVGQEEVNLQQTNVAEEVLREIPGTVPSVGAQANNGNNGASFVDLRGLGITRNLVLLDGVRLVPANDLGAVDLNNIPLALIERVDVLTGGATTTYGADAVSGVVNFITRQDFTGMELNLGSGITEEGDGHTVRADLTIGASFDDGRGNAVFSVGYQEADPVYQGQRDFSAFSYNIRGASGGSGTAIPTAVSFPGTLATGGGFRQFDPVTGLFEPFYAPYNFAPFNIFQTPFERFNLYGAGHYEVADGIEVYTRAMFSNNTVETVVAPSGVFAEQLLLPLSNPYLTDALRTQICNIADFNSTVTGRQGPTGACAATNTTDRAILPAVYRRSEEVGPRVSTYETNLFDIRAGLRGDLTSSIRWDIFGAYGESENQEDVSGYVLKSRLQPALLATNTATCDLAPAGTFAGCVPVNLFGPLGSITPAQVNFLTAASNVIDRTTLAQARATLDGDFGWTSPWATDAIGFAVGAEYRKATASQQADVLAQTPGELGGRGGAFLNQDGEYDVHEAFAEIIAPIVSGRPFFESLTLEAGIRRSHYDIKAPGDPSFNTTTWKVGGSWAPGFGLKFRGNYQRAVRAPNISELFDPITVSLTNLAVDPCAGAQTPAQVTPTNVLNPNLSNPTFVAVCIAQGASPDQIGGIPQPTSGQINRRLGGNPFLEPEKAKTWTVGVVFQPDFVPGFALTVDYYNIKITDAVSVPTVNDVLNACFDNPDPTAARCAQDIRRSPASGGLSGSAATVLGLNQPNTNLGRLATDGIDLTANYRTDLGFARLNLSFAGNWTASSKFQATPSGLNRECTGLYSVNCASIQPEFSWNQRTTLTFGDVDVSLLWRHISSAAYESRIITALANTPLVGTITTGNLAGREVNFGFIEAYDYFDLSGRFGVTDNFDMTVTVTNLLDKEPPIVGSSVGSTTFNSGNTYPATYDPLGRSLRVGARLKF